MKQGTAERKIFTICCVCGVVKAGSSVGILGVSSSTEPVILVHSSSHVAPAAHVDLKVTVCSGRTLSVRQQDVIEGHVSLHCGPSLHTLHHNLKYRACHDRR